MCQWFGCAEGSDQSETSVKKFGVVCKCASWIVYEKINSIVITLRGKYSTLFGESIFFPSNCMVLRKKLCSTNVVELLNIAL